VIMSNSGILQLPDAHGYLDRVIGELRAIEAPHKNTLVNVLEYLSGHIRATRSEIGALRSGSGKSEMFSTTTDELEEIVTETARATNRIMDAAEAVEKVAATLEPGPANALMDATTSIYEASAFQDITGQRITKVVRTLKHIEGKIEVLIQALGEEVQKTHRSAAAADPNNEDSLLNGPQLPGNAIDQSEIDKLLASFD
jgi:chemotaxis protein CheZ